MAQSRRHRHACQRWHAGWLVRGLDLTDTGVAFSLHRLAYDAAAAAAAMRRYGHANGYARTLITGLWPSLDVLPSAERDAMGHRLPEAGVRLRTNFEV